MVENQDQIGVLTRLCPDTHGYDDKSSTVPIRALLNDPMICYSESSKESLQMLHRVQPDRLIHRLIMQRPN